METDVANLVVLDLVNMPIKHIDLFIPDFLGGHQAAKAWGKRHMRLKLDGTLV